MTDLGTRIRGQLEDVEVPARDLSGVARRARTLRTRRYAVGGMVAAIAALGIALPLWSLVPRPDRAPDPAPAGEPSLTADAPRGWEVRTVSPDWWEYGPVLQAGNLALPAMEVEDVTLGSARAELSDRQAIVIVLDTTSQILSEDVDVGEAATWRSDDFPPAEGVLPLDLSDFSTEAGQEGQAVEPEHAFARVQFSLDGRALDAWVDLGAATPPSDLLADVNALLSGIRIIAAPDTEPTIGPAPEPGEAGWAPPWFEPAEGWSSATTGTVDPDNDWETPLTWAANGPIAPEDLDFARDTGALFSHPPETLRSLGPGDVFMQAAIINPGGAPADPTEAAPADDLPLSLADADVRRTWEGQVAENVPEYLFWRTVDGWQLEVRVFFGTLDPSADVLATAQSQLERLRLPEVPPAPPGDTTTYSDSDDGLAVTIPAGWTYHEDPSGPDDPKTLIAFGSWTFEEGGDCAPTAAQAALPPAGALVWVMEYLGQPDLVADIGPRPGSFRFDEETLATYECSLVPSYMFRFRGPDGRAFQAHVALGSAITDETRRRVQLAVGSIEITAPVPETCPAGFGPWADPDCPEQAWVRAFTEAAGHRVTGDTGSALEVEAAGHQVHLWAFIPEGDRPYAEVIAEESYEPYATVNETAVFSDGVRITWEADGLWVWLSSATSDPLPPREVVEGLVRGSLEVDYDAIDTR
jgi:hypothetical protein